MRRRGLTLGSAVGRSFPRTASVVDRGEAQAESSSHTLLNLFAGEQLCGLQISTLFFTFLSSDPLTGSLCSEIACGHRSVLCAMAPSRKTATTAEVALVPLKSCLVNLPTPVVSLLVNANAVRAHIHIIGLHSNILN